jgi:hypothetical protein
MRYRQLTDATSTLGGHELRSEDKHVISMEVDRKRWSEARDEGGRDPRSVSGSDALKVAHGIKQPRDVKAAAVEDAPTHL